MNLGIESRVALVGGASRGIGRAIAGALALEGCDLVLCARGEPDLLRTKDEIESATGRTVVAVAADLAEPGAAARIVETGICELAAIDILVTNTGGPPAGRFEEQPEAAWRDAYTNNLESVLALIRATLPGMRGRGWGRIVNITSVAVKQPIGGLILSNSLRAAVTGFARTLADEVAADGITVNCVMPGYTRTERVRHLAERVGGEDGVEAGFAQWEAEIPVGRLAEPDEIAALVAFLCSERAGYITAQSMAVDGGWIRGLL